MIYIVKSSCGNYDDYREWNEKAFTSKEKAEEYVKFLNNFRSTPPKFVTDDFTKAYIECYGNLPDWEGYSYPVKDRDEYNEWLEERYYRDLIILSEELNKRGFSVSIDDLEEYDNWRSIQLMDYHKCTIEELELNE